MRRKYRCLFVTIKKAGWPLEAEVIIKPWANAIVRSLSSSYGPVLEEPSGFIVVIIITMMRMLIRG